MKIFSKAVVLFSAIIAQGAFAAGAGNTGGGCYNLQLIATGEKKPDMTGTSGHALFLSLNSRTKILLSEGNFNVIDRNGTDGSASFSLPNPDPTNSGTTVYSAFMRVVGKPGSKIDMTTCAYDVDGVLFCNTDENIISMTRIAGTSRFTNVSQQLLYIYADIDGDGTQDRVPLFSEELQDYFWQVDTQGRLHAQIRFCPVSTTVAAP